MSQFSWPLAADWPIVRPPRAGSVVSPLEVCGGTPPSLRGATAALPPTLRGRPHAVGAARALRSHGGCRGGRSCSWLPWQSAAPGLGWRRWYGRHGGGLTGQCSRRRAGRWFGRCATAPGCRIFRWCSHTGAANWQPVMHTTTLMRLVWTLLVILLIGGCASSSVERPEVDPQPYPDANFSGVLDHDYYTTVIDEVDLEAKEKEEGVRYVRSSNPAFQPPQVVGGQAALRDTIAAVTRGFTCPVRGTVYVSALLDRDGNVHVPQLRAGIHEACDQRALEVMKRTRLQPATLEGEPVSMLYTLPVTFR